MATPEKEYFTLTEIIKRWERANIDHVTLLDYARRDILIYSVYLRDIGSHARETVDVDGTIRTTTTTVMHLISPDGPYQPIRYLKSDDARRILESKDSERIAVSVLYSSPLRHKESGMGYMQPHYFTPDDLLVTKEERDRFEKQFNVKVISKFERLWKWLADPGNQKALTLIGGGITALFVTVWQIYSRFFH